MINWKQINAMKKAIGAFLRSRRESIGWNKQQLRDRAEVGGAQLEAMETGAGNPTEETLLRVMSELGVSLHLCEQNSDEAVAVTIEGASSPPPFLLCADAKSMHLYVLHWQHPAFLVQVIQTVPHQQRIVATYGPTAAEVRQLPIWKDLDVFVRKSMKDTTLSS